MSRGGNKEKEKKIYENHVTLAMHDCQELYMKVLWKKGKKKNQRENSRMSALVIGSQKSNLKKKIIGHEHIQSGDDKKCKLIDSSSHQRFWQIGETMYNGQII